MEMEAANSLDFEKLVIYLSVLGLSCDFVVCGLSCPDIRDLSSPIRDQTSVPCVGRWALHHWSNKEVPSLDF